MKKIVFFSLILAMLALDIDARVVSGSVVSGKKKLSGVIVSDGTNFTKTSKNGKFTFDIKDDAPFVYIMTPSGYVADWSTGVPAFYQKAADKDEFVFDLIETAPADTYNIIAIGDPQPKYDEQFAKFAGEPLGDIIETIPTLKGVTVGVVLGDVCYDKFHLMRKWKTEIVRAGVPFYTAPGNHDHDKRYTDDVQSINVYREILGPENYAVFLGDDIMIVLDNIIYDGGRSNYKEGYTDAVIAWVEGLMKYVDDDSDIYVVQHSPLNGRNNKKMTINHDKMLKLLQGHKVTFMSGHNHINGNFEYAENVREHNVAAICGTWWETYHCKDGTPSGYKVYTKADDALTWYYKSVGRDKSFQFEVYAPGQCRENPASVVVNVWDYDPCWRVEWYQDGVYMGLLKQVEEYCPLHAADLKAIYDKQGVEPAVHKLTMKASHYFAATPTEGASEILIKVTDRFGNVMNQTLSLK